ncbi:MAG: Ig domain-containing protein [Lachnospiraceae bacterium]
MKMFEKRKLKRWMAVFLLLTLAVTQCLNPAMVQAATKKTIAVKTIQLEKKSLQLDKGKTATLKVTITPKAAKNAKLVWKSSKPNVASVSQKGKITAKNAGNAKITVTVKGTKKVASCTIKVLIPVSKLTVTPTKAALKAGESVQLKAKIAPANASYRKLSYQSKDSKIASVDKKGTITAKKAGKTTITVQVTDTKKKVTIPVTVEKEEAGSEKPSVSEPDPSEPTSEPTTPSTSESDPTSIPTIESNPTTAGSSEIPAEPSTTVSEPLVSSIPAEPSVSVSEPSTTESASERTSETPSAEPSTTVSEPSKAESTPSIQPSESKPSEEEPSSEETGSLQNKKQLKTYLQRSKQMKERFTDETQKKKVEDMIQTAEDVYKTGKTQEELQEQILILKKWINACTRSVSVRISTSSFKTFSYSTKEDDKGITTLTFFVKKSLADQVTYRPEVSSSTLEIRKSNLPEFEQELVVTAENSYTVVYEVQKCILSENPLYIKSVEDEDGIIGYWHTYVKEETDDVLEMRLGIQLKGKNGLTDAFRVTAKQKNATVKIEDYKEPTPAYYPCIKKVTLSAVNAKKTVYYVYCYHMDEWKIQSLNYGGTSCSIQSQTQAYSDSDGYLLLKDSYEEGKELQVTPLYDDVKWKVTDSDKEGYQKKILLSKGTESVTYYVKFATEADKLHILDVYVNGKLKETGNWNVYDEMEQGTYIHTLTIYNLLPEDEVQIVPVSEETTATVSDSDLPGYMKKIELTNAGKTKVYYVKNTGESNQWIQSVKVDGVTYVNGMNEDTSKNPYFRESGSGDSTLYLYGEKEPDWKNFEVIPYDSGVTVSIENSDSSGYQKKVTLQAKDQTKTYYVSWNYKETIWEPASVSADGVVYKNSSYYMEHENYSYEMGYANYKGYDDLAESDNQTFTLYGYFSELPKDLQIQPSNSQTTMEVKDGQILMTHGKMQRCYDIDYKLPTEAWEIQSIQTGGQTILDRDHRGPGSTSYFEQKTDFYEEENRISVYGQPKTEEPIQITMKNPDVKVSVLPDTKENSDAKIVMEYLGEKKTYHLQYVSNDTSAFAIKEIQSGDWKYLPGYISDGMPSDGDGNKVEETGTFSQSSDTIIISGIASTLGNDLTFTMNDPSITAQIVASDRDGYEKKVIFTKGEKQKEYAIHYQVNVSVWSLESVKSGTIAYQYQYPQEEPFYTYNQNYWSAKVNELTLYGTEKAEPENLSVTAKKAGVNVTVSDTTRKGYWKKLTLTYGRYQRVYFVKYDALPKIWNLASIQAGQTLYGERAEENTPYLLQSEKGVTLYGTEKETPAMTNAIAENPEVTCELADKKVTLTYGSLKKELPIQYQPLDTIWNLKTVQAGTQTYEKRNYGTNQDYYWCEEYAYDHTGSYKAIKLYGLEAQPAGEYKLEAENPDVQVKLEETDKADTLKKVVLTYGTFTKTLYLVYDISETALTPVQVKVGTDVYEAYDYEKRDQMIYFETSSYYDPTDTDYETTKKTLLLTGNQAAIGTDFSVTFRSPNAKTSIEDCNIVDQEYTQPGETPRVYTKKVTVEYAGKKVIYFVACQLREDFWNIKEIHDGDTVYSSEPNAKNRIEQSRWDDTLEIYGEKEGLSNDLIAKLNVQDTDPNISITCEYMDGVLTLHYGDIAKTFTVRYEKTASEDDW